MVVGIVIVYNFFYLGAAVFWWRTLGPRCHPFLHLRAKLIYVAAARHNRLPPVIMCLAIYYVQSYLLLRGIVKEHFA